MTIEKLRLNCLTLVEARAMADEIERLHASFDPPICRLQFPDGSVPGNIFECAKGWKHWYESHGNEVALSITARDRLWCRAVCEALDTFEIERLTRRFNELREEPFPERIDEVETLARQLYETDPKPPGPPDPPFGSPHFPKSEAEKYRAMARERLQADAGMFAEVTA